ncbi:unnamed protein product [Rhizoctonia solani]|uniref:Uncharacterized protein n=1 Tax=Rhizoctonia solani TaxID=456999 RepID=A0A8H3CLK1_9AGAM|nr:unnamed protein product [Rhizoctonia solani]
MSRYFTASFDRRDARKHLESIDAIIDRTDKLLKGSKSIISPDEFESYEDCHRSLLSQVNEAWSGFLKREKKYYFFIDKQDKEDYQMDLDFLRERCEGYNQDVASTSRRALKNMASATSSTTTFESPQSSAASVPISMDTGSSTGDTGGLLMHDKHSGQIVHGKINSLSLVFRMASTPNSTIAVARVASKALPSQQDKSAKSQSDTFMQLLVRVYEDGRRIVALDQTHYGNNDMNQAEESLQEISQLASAAVEGNARLENQHNVEVFENDIAVKTIDLLLSSLSIN